MACVCKTYSLSYSQKYMNIFLVSHVILQTDMHERKEVDINLQVICLLFN